MVWMTIEQALLHIRTSTEPFTIRFVISAGKNKGSIKTMHAINGAPKPNPVQIPGDQKSVPSKKVMKHEGMLTLTDLRTNTLATPLISHLISFNKFNIKH
jgi:hypothetical protein